MVEEKRFAIVQWEDKFTSIIRLDDIKQPRKPVEEYRDGDYVVALFHKKAFKARISQISDNKSDLLAEKNKNDEFPLKFTYESENEEHYTHDTKATKTDVGAKASPTSVQREQNDATKTAFIGAKTNHPPVQKEQSDATETDVGAKANTTSVQREQNDATKTALIGAKTNHPPVQKEQSDATKTDLNGAKTNHPPVQKVQSDALLKRNVQKELAESLLLKRLDRDETGRTHRDFVSMKDFLILKEDVRNLKRKLDKLDQHKKKSTTLQATLQSTPRKSPRREVRPSPKKTPKKTPNKSDVLYNNHSKSSLQDAVAHIDALYPTVKTLMLMLFPENYIASHSVSGKASNSKQTPKPAFDHRLYSLMVQIIKEKHGSSTKEITEKVHSVQKWVQKRML